MGYTLYNRVFNKNRLFYSFSLLSSILLFAVSVFFIFPPAHNTEEVNAAPTPSETTLSMTTPTISLALSVDSSSGTFATSSPSAFTVTTNNYTGYTLSIRAKENNENYSKLISGNNVLNSIESATADSTGFNIGDWGYKPSKLDSQANTDYLPAPTYTGSTLDVTNAANSTANTYSIALAAKADYAIASGSYTNTFVLAAVGKPVNYTITYDKNTTDTVSNMPSGQTGTLGASDITLSSNTISRAYYDFLGWCDAEITNNTCSGTTYAPGDTIPTSMQTVNTFNLHAIWSPTNYTISYTLNSGSASGNPAAYNIETANFTLNSPTRTGYTFAGWTGTGISTISRSVTVSSGSTGNRSYTANWCLNEKLFTYSGAVESYTIPQYCSGSYQLEAWGAEGGTGTYESYQGIGGKGGYSEGTLSLQANTPLYIAVGGKGKSLTGTGTITGGFNGGGSTTLRRNNIAGGSGGGATSIAYINGTIGDGLTADTADQVLLIAGGGAGGSCFSSTQNAGAHGGGDSVCNGTGCSRPTGVRGSIAYLAEMKFSPNPQAPGTSSPGIMGAGGGAKSIVIRGSTTSASTSSGGYGLNNISGGTMQSGIREGDGQAKITLMSLSD